MDVIFKREFYKLLNNRGVNDENIKEMLRSRRCLENEFIREAITHIYRLNCSVEDIAAITELSFARVRAKLVNWKIYDKERRVWNERPYETKNYSSEELARDYNYKTEFYKLLNNRGVNDEDIKEMLRSSRCLENEFIREAITHIYRLNCSVEDIAAITELSFARVRAKLVSWKIYDKENRYGTDDF